MYAYSFPTPYIHPAVEFDGVLLGRDFESKMCVFIMQKKIGNLFEIM